MLSIKLPLKQFMLNVTIEEIQRDPLKYLRQNEGSAGHTYFPLVHFGLHILLKSMTTTTICQEITARL
jgi:hypothetical protein